MPDLGEVNGLRSQRRQSLPPVPVTHALGGRPSSASLGPRPVLEVHPGGREALV